MNRRPLVHLLAMAVLTALTVGLGVETTADAGPNLNARLRGDYAFNATLACVQNQAGFGAAPGLQVLTPGPGQTGANTRTISVDGVIRFNGDGTGTAQARALTVIHNFTFPSAQPVGESEFTVDVSYTVNPDGTFTAELTVSGDILSGISAGLPLEISDIMRQGRIGQGGQTLIISNTFANVEDVLVGTTSFKRICGRSGAAVRITPNGD